MAQDFHQNSVVMDHSLKTRKLTFNFSVTASVTAASKTVASDLPGVCFMATEGLLTPVTGIEAVSGLTNYTAPNDGNGILIVMLKGAELGSVKKVLSIRVLENASTGFGTVTLQALGTAQGLTAGGNIAFEVDTGTDFSTTAATFVAEVEYLLSE